MGKLKLRSIAAICVLAAAPSSADSTTLAGSQGFTTYSGPFDFYVVKGTCMTSTNLTLQCDGPLYVDIEEGRRGALRLMSGGIKLSFHVPFFGSSEVRVDGLAVGHANGTATGSCRIGDLYSGPAVIECRAHGIAGSASFAFESDGSPPIHMMI